MKKREKITWMFFRPDPDNFQCMALGCTRMAVEFVRPVIQGAQGFNLCLCSNCAEVAEKITTWEELRNILGGDITKGGET